MSLKKKNMLYIVLPVLLALILGLGLQLGMGYLNYRKSTEEAGKAAELLMADCAALLSAERPEPDSEAMACNEEMKLARAERLEGLELLMLVNPWNPLPEGYEPQVCYLNDVDPTMYYLNDMDMIDVRAAEPLANMLSDCRAAGFGAYVVSAYRPHELQRILYENKMQRVLWEGNSWEEAPDIAAQAVAVPGTSEHELGLAVDIVDVSYPFLNENQMDTAAQQWLMENCWDYGFILRFPEGSSEITGIIYEPWHYRYVGREYALEMKELGLTLEEYTALRRGR